MYKYVHVGGERENGTFSGRKVSITTEGSTEVRKYGRTEGRNTKEGKKAGKKEETKERRGA